MRVSRRLTLAQVSKKMGISLPYLANLEQGIKDFNYELEDKFRLALK
jgi:transcriptional regulator with XRE-family HTH domain